MKLIRTKGSGARQTAETLAALEDRGGAALDAVLPAVRRSIASGLALKPCSAATSSVRSSTSSGACTRYRQSRRAVKLQWRVFSRVIAVRCGLAEINQIFNLISADLRLS